MMTRKEHIKLAQQAFIDKGFWPNEVMWKCWEEAWLAGVAAERERCALVCEEFYSVEHLAQKCAEAIRKGE